MKRKIKTLITAFAVSAVSAFAVMASGCMGVPEWLEQARCTHKWNDGEVTKAATCEDVGEKTVTCTLCGYEDIEYIPAKGHAWINTDAVEPTCTHVGQMAGIRCATCAEWFIEATEVPATGHIDVTDTGKAATCTETGLTDGSHCGVCNEILTAQEEIPANGHNVVTVAGKAATCTETGLTDREVCETCGVTLVEQEEIPMVACADEDGDGYCDMCNIIMPLAEGTYTEVAVTEGQTFVEGFYRLYRSDGNASWSSGACHSTSFKLGGRYFDVVAKSHLMGNCLSIETFGSCSSLDTAYIRLGSTGPVKGIVEGFSCAITEDYIDIFITEGSFNVLNADLSVVDGQVLEITSESIITDVFGPVYYLQVNEGGEVAQPDDVVHPAEGTYTEVAATVGEKVAGNWYRVYRNSDYIPPTQRGFCFVDNGYSAVYYDGTNIFYFSAENGEVLGLLDSYIVKTDAYVDIYIPLGLSFVFPSDREAYNITITENSTIAKIGSSANVKRLVLNQ